MSGRLMDSYRLADFPRFAYFCQTDWERPERSIGRLSKRPSHSLKHRFLPPGITPS